MPDKRPRRTKIVRRFGAAELFGQALVSLTPDELRRSASAGHREFQCPFRASGKPCSKKGGVCSLGLFEQDEAGVVRIVGMPVTTCPNRFLEGNKAFAWVGETLLRTSDPRVVSGVSFLMAEGDGTTRPENEGGRIDSVLVTINKHGLVWCALEMQAAYSRGGSMEDDFALMRQWNGPGIPFPAKQRRPDFRSSGQRQLMPQLQTEIPSLRHWGKKVAVVIDIAFWKSLGEISRVKHVSNADIVWFIVDYEGPRDGRYQIKTHEAVCTTLEDAVDGLTGGTSVPLEQFEHAILRKLPSSATR